MKITWIGHSCFKIESKGCSIILDPYADGSVPGYKPIRERVNAVFCSHGHGDHNGVSCVEIIPDAEFPFTVTTVETYHDDQMGKLRGKNIIHIIDDGECRIAHLGDIGCSLNEEQIRILSDLDAVMIPVGGYYTINAVQAEEMIEQIKPKMVLPMHYRDTKEDIVYGYDEIEGISKFLEDFSSVKTLERSEVDAKNIPAGVVVLQPQNH